MIMFKGIFYDGRTSAQRPVTGSVDAGMLRITGEGLDLCCPISQVTVVPRLGNIRDSLRLPEGGLLETGDRQVMDLMIGQQRQGRFLRLLHRWENGGRYILFALLAIGIIVTGVIRYGIPALAKKAAFAVPPAMDASLASETLRVLDKLVFSPSRLPAARRQALTDAFGGMTRRLPYGGKYRLEFRWSDKIGANAFALPSGTIVITDQLITLARKDDEIIGVLAHEMGHVRNRHALRQVLQDSSAGLIIATLAGDITSITTLGATLPTALIDAEFSRDFEREADDAAIAYLKSAGIAPRSFAEFLARMETVRFEAKAAKGNAAGPEMGDYFSSHPGTKERILRILGRDKSP